MSPFAKGPDRVEIGKVEVALRNKDLEYAQVNGTDGMMLAMFSLKKTGSVVDVKITWNEHGPSLSMNLS